MNLLDKLKNHKTIKILKLKFLNFNKKIYKGLNTFLKHNASLEFLDIAGNYMTDYGIE